MKRRICALVASFSVAVHAQTVPMDPVGFTEFGAQAMRTEVGPDVPVKVKGPLTLGIDELQLNLDRAYAFCQRNVAECRSALTGYSKNIAAFLKERNAPIDGKAVLLAVRSSAYIQNAQATLGRDAPALATRPLAQGLVTIAMFDTPSAARPLNAKDAARLSLSNDELLALATKNLQASLEPLSTKAKPVASGQVGTLQGSYYEASRLALTAEWASLAAAQNGTLLVAAPSPDVILYVSESSPTAVDALRALAKTVAAKSQTPLSLAVFKWTAEGWVIP
ncbi:hypothetical protein GTP46_21245 [Duganella sp. FT135W]|uniref:DUF541 domain-containing protein n=1 Tax=Duganella flavida TaxID=2692175 RepID=A0A6L8KFY5_9BURK|nr:hypothetical protein [Duganella flavida]MYM25158.1 hypothetical protein [Duganella flavida]